MASVNTPLCSLLLLVAMATIIAAEPDLSVCDPSANTYPYEGPPLPELPEQYHLKVEGVISNKGYTILLEEFYDNVNNRGAANSVHENYTWHTSYDYKLDQAVQLMVDSKGKSHCNVTTLSTSRFSLFGFHIENGTGHINGSGAIFRFGKEYNETYMNMTSIRGVPANHWQRCAYSSRSNSTYLLDFYFSAPGFKMPFGGDQVPLRATINGSGFDRMTGEKRAFFHNYEYLEVRPGPVDIERAFEPPLGVYCPGYKRTKPFPKVPDTFSVDIESVSPGENRIHFTREVYNYPAKLVAYIYQPWNETSNNASIFREVHDYNIGLSYKMDYATEKCTIGPIPVHSYFYDDQSTDGIHVQLRSPQSFLLQDIDNWIYEGNTTLREVDAEAWIASGNYTDESSNWNYTVEYFFARGNWSGDGKIPASVHQMPLSTKYFGEGTYGDEGFHSFMMTSNMYHFTTDIFHHDFEVYSCYDQVDSEFLAMDVLGINIYERFIVNNSHTFYAAVQHALANASSLPASRIANIYAVEGKDQIMIIYFEMLGVPAVEGNAVDMSTQPSLAEGFIKLEERNLSPDPIIIVVKREGKEENIGLYQGSLRYVFHDTDEKSTGIKKSTAAGIGIAMFILGILVAAGASYFYVKRIMAPPVPYGVQS